MKYKVGDRVKIQSLERYNKYKNRYGDINYGCETEILFTSEMSSFCGQVVTITRVRYIGCVRFYHLAEDKGVHLWVDGMFEGLVEEETKLDIDKVMEEHQKIVDEIFEIQGIEPIEAEEEHIVHCPEGYIFKDENGNVIDTHKIILEKKKEYPKTYEECCGILKEQADVTYGYKKDVLHSFQKLLVCRDAYWKIAGEEMGLGKPWEPDWKNSEERRYCIVNIEGDINLPEKILTKWILKVTNKILVFPTEEMRDAFYENFDPDIEKCKEFL